MPQIDRRRFAIIIFLVVFLGPTYVDAQRPLFSPADLPEGTLPRADASTLRTRYVTFDGDFLRKPDSASDQGRTLLLNLFPDVTFKAVLDRIDRIGSSLVWVGRISGRESSSVTLSVENKTVYGRIAVDETVYVVRFVKGEAT